MCINGECGRVTATVEIGCIDFGIGEAALAASAITTAGGVANAHATNATNSAIAGTNTAANAYMQVQNQQYNAEEARKAREFNLAAADHAVTQGRENMGWQMDFNREESQKNRDYQTEMSNTQYQRAIGDMKAAGLNPMLAYKNGGAGTPAGGAASGAQSGVSTAQGASASSGGWAGPGKWEAVGPLGNSLNSAAAGLELSKKLEMYDAQIKNTNADTADKLGETTPSLARVREVNARADKLSTEIDQVIQDVSKSKQDEKTSAALANLHEANSRLTNAQERVAAGTLQIQDLQKANIAADTALKRVQQQIGTLPAAISTGAGKIVEDAKKSVGDAVGAGNIFKKAYDYGAELGSKLRNAW